MAACLRFVMAGYAQISAGFQMDRSNIQIILRSLEAKRAIRVALPVTCTRETGPKLVRISRTGERDRFGEEQIIGILKRGVALRSAATAACPIP